MFKYAYFMVLTTEVLFKFIMGFPDFHGSSDTVQYFRSAGARFTLIDSEVSSEVPSSPCPWCDAQLIQSVSYRVDQNSYLAGCYSGLVSKSKKVACK